MMGIRLVEMRRILKPTGSIYLHCDPTASHYLKILMDAVFGVKHFMNELVWCYSWPRNSKRYYARTHDIILFYTLGDKWTFNADAIRQPYAAASEGRDAYAANASQFGDAVVLDERGKLPQDWVILPPVRPNANERAGYPTQKPMALYKRIIQASSNEGDLVLDPFCGCGTTLLAAEALNRRWLGIDLTYLATGAVKLQVEKFFPQLKDSIVITGTPEDAATALQLARENPVGFEAWCVTHVLKFTANAKKGGDGGIDGTYRFPLGKVKGRTAYGRMVAQVKGGRYTLGHIRDFRTAMANAQADLGIFVVTKEPSAGMRAEASRAGTWQHPMWDMACPRLQFYEIQDYFAGTEPKVPFGERRVL